MAHAGGRRRPPRGPPPPDLTRPKSCGWRSPTPKLCGFRSQSERKPHNFGWGQRIPHDFGGPATAHQVTVVALSSVKRPDGVVQFVAGTRAAAVALCRERGWNEAAYRRTVDVLRVALPHLDEGRDGFVPM